MVKFMSGAETKCVGFIIDGKAIGCTQGCGKNFDNSFELKTEPNYVALFGTKQIAIKNNKATLVKEGTAIMAVCILMSLYLIIRIIFMINIFSN